MLIDAHCHVLSTEYDDVLKVLDEAINNGVDKIIINGYDVKSSREAVFLADKYDFVYAAVGIGPGNVSDATDADLLEIERLATFKKVVAIGEIGLDYYWTKENKDKQVKTFRKMLGIAKSNHLPVIIHNRNATEDTINLLKEYNVTGIMHCFSGGLKTAQALIKLGFLIGVGGVVTFRNARKLKEVVEGISLSSISLETDSPYLSPEPFREKQNTPSNLTYVANKIAEIKGVSYEEVVDITSLAVTSKFDLSS